MRAIAEKALTYRPKSRYTKEKHDHFLTKGEPNDGIITD
ncbi:hypothetical protein KR50_33820 [Jeotgalibacillus campisalis]|uniref:Uncharacterized protein n=1 Tax=Jeotgalibacillus campisalis TaxID=220754 RepID=A0A0C2RMJ8_9BACL|nr:hypothetical protein KR50_33820 [Jeotgalibacillus campisalis]